MVQTFDEFAEMEIRPKLGVSCRRLVSNQKLMLKVPTYSECVITQIWEFCGLDLEPRNVVQTFDKFSEMENRPILTPSCRLLVQCLNHELWF